jgi:hypothetical protein
MTAKTLASIALGASACAAMLRSRKNLSRAAAEPLHATPAKSEQARQEVDDAARRYLMYAIMPVWAIAGFLDWLWHRQTHIETTSGVKESAMHLLMMAEAGAPILTGLFLEMNAGALVLMASGWLLHELTVAWDVEYTISRRKIYTREQQTHGYMQTIPFDIVATLACLYPEHSLALVGLGSEKPDFRLRLRKAPVPIKHFAAIVSAMGILSGLPHVEELWRCYRAQLNGRAGSEIAECTQELYASQDPN